jgi:hypothetical protein
MAAAVGSWVLGQWHQLVGSPEASEEASKKDAPNEDTSKEDTHDAEKSSAG